MKTVIIPAILEPDQKKFNERFRAINGHSQVVQLDILDNSFLPHEDFHDPLYIDSLKPDKDFELHFMTDLVSGKLPLWNYSWVKKVIFHAEAHGDIKSTIAEIKAMGKQAWLAINPGTSVKAIVPFLHDLDGVQVMTINPGQMGTPFLPETIEKIAELVAIRPQLAVEVDGGINPETIKRAAAAGASSFVVGSYLKNDEFQARLGDLKKSLSE